MFQFTYRVVVAFFGLLFTQQLFGDPLVTDRPDATESSSVMAPGVGQLELGWLSTETEDGQINEFPQTLLRVGVHQQIEFRFAWSGYLSNDTSGAPTGAGDGDIGTKIYLREEKSVYPEIALLAGVSLPWGDNHWLAEIPGFK